MRLEGQQIGRYRFERLIGRGGMGEVYLAVDPRISQQVAVKVLRTETTVYPTTNVDHEAQRFRREASAIANLRHRNIVPLFDYNETTLDESSLTYLVEPYYKEGSFADWLRKRGSNLLPMEDVAYFVQQAAAALQYAHDRQIIHRDVKPTNFLIDSSENPNRPNLLLSDFGISKFGMGGTDGIQSLGTLTYEAPEQLHGQPTYASDQYSLAIMAYELLVGRPPFEGPSAILIRAHMEEQPRPPSLLNPHLPRSVDHVLLRALDKRPENRYPSISEFARALQQALPKTGVSPQLRANSAVQQPPASGAQRHIPAPQPQSSGDMRASQRHTPAAQPQIGRDVREPLRGGDMRAPFPSPAVSPPPQVSRPEPQSGTKSRTIIIAVSAILIVLVAIGGLFAFLLPALNRGPDLNATATATAQANATATRDAGLTATAEVTSPFPRFTNLVFQDALTGGNSQWQPSSACQFKPNGYLVSDAQAGTFQRCQTTSSFSDFAFKVTMTIVNGDCGGMVFRVVDNENFYVVLVCSDGTYDVGLFQNGKPYWVTALAQRSSSSAIHQGPGQQNVIAIVVQGNTLNLYVNDLTKVVHPFTDNSNTFSHGAIGLLSNDFTNPTAVMYTNALVWT